MERKKFIENDVICLAECVESDYPILFESWNENDTIWGYNYKLPYSFEEYCERCKDSRNWGAVIVRLKDDEVIGRIGISEGLPDLTITVFQPYRQQGYGTMAFMLGIKYCFEILKTERHIFSGEERIQLDFVLENPLHPIHFTWYNKTRNF